MLAKVLSSGFLGIDPYQVEVEVDISNGLPVFNIVGLADAAISESRERVKAAIKNCGFSMNPKRILVNLSPAGIRKEGPQFDLPIAIGIMRSFGYVKDDTRLLDYMFIGELSLGGGIKRTNGVINAVICAKEKGMKGIVIPRENMREAVMIEGIEVIPVKTLKEVVEFIDEGKVQDCDEDYTGNYETKEKLNIIDFKEVKGQYAAKRALEISAAGGHNLFMVGSPGSGKSMLAKRLPTIMPGMTQKEIVESTKIYSSNGLLDSSFPIVNTRPFRNPHHSSSVVALVGGGRIPKAGEITLAHTGVLFLDEATEFPKNVLETLRQPVEDRKISITRASYRVDFPTDFILVLASNPCNCGLLFEEGGKCNCTQHQINNYKKKISGPIVDRMDLYVEVKKLKTEELLNYGDGETSEIIRNRVESARERQYTRMGEGRLNSNMTQKDIKKYCKLDGDGMKILKGAVESLGLSARGYDKALKVARTIADLENRENINKSDILEALSYRKK
ncbi:YifB family Mg chelatase-like AAA ATPase [uncultured Ilyobacter sp.]|uniref:YifB family Mg chelatase-like AAA ATPase n=1 Tax=uncultured Ilyobacter sp. TaxID=544433 RepID=UPI0029C65F62|nr:YifB family Mg chelatase-like AAA ATPase [uncultured Ilyobacter sp.]